MYLLGKFLFLGKNTVPVSIALSMDVTSSMQVIPILSRVT